MQLLLTSNVGAFYSEKQIMQFPLSAKIVHFSLRNCWLHSSLSWCWIQMTEWDGHLLRRSTVPLWRLLFHSHHLSNMQHWKNPGEKVLKRNSQPGVTPEATSSSPLSHAWKLTSNSTAVEQTSQKHEERVSSNLSVWKIKHLSLHREPPRPTWKSSAASVWNTGVSVVNRAKAKSGAAESLCRRNGVLQKKGASRPFREDGRLQGGAALDEHCGRKKAALAISWMNSSALEHEQQGSGAVCQINI